MLQLQLYIEGQEVELYKDESVTLTQSIQDVTDIKKIFTDFSRTFSVPASKVNNKIFKHFYNFYIDGFDARKKKDAELFLNYKPFKKGKIKLEGTTLKNNEAKTYRITFYGNTVVLPDLIGEDKLGALSELQVFDFRYNDANIQTYLTNGLDNTIGVTQIDDAVIFPLITHSNRLIYDSSLDETYNLYDGGSSNGVPFTELKPALRIDAIIKAIELHYDINFSEDFFNSENTPYYNLYMWLHTKPGGLFVDQEKAQQFTRLSLVTNSSREVDELVVRSNNYRINNADAKLEFHKRIHITPTLNNVEYNLVIQRNGQEFRRFDGLTGETKNGLTDYNTEEDAIIVDNGEFSIFIETSSAASFDLKVKIVRINTRFLGGRKEENITSTLESFTDTNISIARQLPDMKIMDFLTGLFTMFNLTAFVKDDGTIVIQTLDDFYASSKTTYDLTSNVVTDESQIDSTIPYKQVNLFYKGRSTFLASNFEKQNNKGWGTLEYEASSKYEGAIYKIELPFEHMLYEKLNDADTGSQTNIQWGWHTDEKQETSQEEPLLFYPVKATSGSVAFRNIANTQLSVTTPYMPSNSEAIWSGNGVSNMSQSINFHAEIDEFVLRPNEKTLFETYYKKFIVDLFDVNKRITKVSAFIPLSIIQKLSLADSIVIFDKQYRINKLTTNFETNKSNLELLNVLDDTIAPVKATDIQVDITSDDITVDNTFFTVDKDSVTSDGFEIAGSKEVPDVIISNDPIRVIGCKVIAPQITEGNRFGDENSITFQYNLSVDGSLCGQPRVSEYGFLIANDSSTLTVSDDIDTLKADSSITVVNVTSELGSPSIPLGLKKTIIDGLTDPATRFGRFYARTNISDEFDKADVISNVFSSSTVAANEEPEQQFLVLHAGIGRTGYSTLPTLQNIQDNNVGVTQREGGCGSIQEHAIFHHNGTGLLPIVGDKIKSIEKSSYDGEDDSFSFYYPHIPESYTNDFAAFSVAVVDETKRSNSATLPTYLARYNISVNKYIVFKLSTAEVVSVYDCPSVNTSKEVRVNDAGYGVMGFANPPTLNDIINGRYAISKGITCETRFTSFNTHYFDGAGDYPVAGDKYKTALSYNYNGGTESAHYYYSDFSSRYYVMAVLDKVDPSTGNNINSFIIVDFIHAEVHSVLNCS